MPRMVRGLPQPASGASMNEKTSRPRPNTAIRAPPRSSWGAFWSADSVTNRIAPVMDTIANPTLSPNTARHDHTSSSKPDASNPTTALAPATPAQTLTARRRCCAGKVPVIVDSVAGMTSAAPAPSRPRSTISSVAPAGRHRHCGSDTEDR